MPDGGYIPLNRAGRVFAQGVTEKTLPAGRYRLHFLLRGKYDATDNIVVRVNGEVITPRDGEYEFVVPLAALDGPTLARVSWDGKLAGTQAPAEALASASLLHLERLSPLVLSDLAVDKILYRPNEHAVATAVIHNYAAEPLKAGVRFSEITGLADRRLLGEQPVEARRR